MSFKSSFFIYYEPPLLLLLLASLFSFPPLSGYPPLLLAVLPLYPLPTFLSLFPDPRAHQCIQTWSILFCPRFPFTLPSIRLPVSGLRLPLEPQHGTSPLCSGLTALVQLKADPWHSMLGLVLWPFDSPRLPFTCRASHTQSLHLRPVSSSPACCTQNLGPW